jgi:hypothetical protein
MSTSNILIDVNTTKSVLDERVQIVGRIFQSVGICAVIWGADALLHHGISTIKQVCNPSLLSLHSKYIHSGSNHQRNDFLIPNEDFLRAAEALRLHSFTVLDPSPGSEHYVSGLEHYGAQYMFPLDLIERLGSEVTVSLFPASFVSWKLVYVGVRDVHDRRNFTTSLVIQKIQFPLEEKDVENSFIQVSESSLGEVHYTQQFGNASMEAAMEDTIALDSDEDASTVDGNDDTDEEYILITPSPRIMTRRQSIPMQRGNGPKSPEESICEIFSPVSIPVTQPEIPPSNLIAMEAANQTSAVDFSIKESLLEPDPQKPSLSDKPTDSKEESAKELLAHTTPVTEIQSPPIKSVIEISSPEIDVSDLSPDPTAGAVEMLPGQKMLERTEGTLTHVAPGIWVCHMEGLKESFVAAGEFIRRDGMGLKDFARGLERWERLVGGRK